MKPLWFCLHRLGSCKESLAIPPWGTGLGSESWPYWFQRGLCTQLVCSPACDVRWYEGQCSTVLLRIPSEGGHGPCYSPSERAGLHVRSTARFSCQSTLWGGSLLGTKGLWIIPDILDWVEKCLKMNKAHFSPFSPVSMLPGIIIWELGETSPECDTFPEIGASERKRKKLIMWGSFSISIPEGSIFFHMHPLPQWSGSLCTQAPQNQGLGTQSPGTLSPNKPLYSSVASFRPFSTVIRRRLSPKVALGMGPSAGLSLP